VTLMNRVAKAARLLNDGPWSSDAARTAACIPLALLVESDAAPGWATRYILRTIREIVPRALRAAAQAHPDAAHVDRLRAAAERCAAEASEHALTAAYVAAQDAAWATPPLSAGRTAETAASAAFAARYALMSHLDDEPYDYVTSAAYAAVWAARASSDPDDVLRRGVSILVECHRGTTETT